jgi:hypothetical protein
LGYNDIGDPMAIAVVFFLLLGAAIAVEEITIDPWVIPIDNIPYPQRSAAVGDVVSFHYSGNHNVYVAIQDDFSCDTDSAELVGGSGDGSANYTFSSASTLVTFFCDFTTHCDRGQQLGFQVYPTRDQVPPTEAPTTSPTPAPSSYSAAPTLVPTVQTTSPPFVPLFDTTFSPTSAGPTSRSVLTLASLIMSGAIFLSLQSLMRL